MVRFITTWRRRSNRYLGIVAKALGNASISQVFLSGEFPDDWAVLRLADKSSSGFVNTTPYLGTHHVAFGLIRFGWATD